MPNLTSNIAANSSRADLAKGGDEGEPAAKRTKLESVVPVPAPAKKKVAAKGQPPPTPPQPCPPTPPLWLSGQLPPSQRGRGAGQQNPTYRGGGPVRGSPRGGYRGADRGHRGRSKAASAGVGAAGKR